jgi:hypothetical protein
MCGRLLKGEPMDFSTREVAILIWSIILVLWTASHQSVRTSFLQVFKSAMNRSILGFVGLVATYTFAEVYLLYSLGLWSTELLKTTLGWFALTGLTSGANALTSYDNPSYGKHVKDSLRIAVFLELVFGKFTFSLPVELVLVPFVTLVTLLAAVNDMRNKDPLVKRFLAGVQVVVGLIVLIVAGVHAVREFSAVANPGVLMEFLLPPVLSFLFIPAMYLIVLYARYEWLFLKIQGERKFRWYARLRLLRLLGAHPKSILAFGRKYAFVLPGIRTRDELQKLLEGKVSAI